ncbi:hypothetical protein HKD37_03G006673 [Glycine soja]
MLFFSNILIIEILILQKYKTTKQFKKKGCLHYDKLSTIFGDTIASSANQHPSTKSPSISDDDDGEEHDDDQDEHSSQKKRRHFLADHLDEEIENVTQLYIMFEYTSFLKPKPQPQRKSILKGHE